MKHGMFSQTHSQCLTRPWLPHSVQWAATRVKGGEETPGFDLNQWDARAVRLGALHGADDNPASSLPDWVILSAPGARFHMRPPGFHRSAVPKFAISLIMQLSLVRLSCCVSVELVPRRHRDGDRASYPG